LQFHRRQLETALQCLEEIRKEPEDCFLAVSSEAIRNCPSVFRGKSKKTRGLFSMASYT